MNNTPPTSQFQRSSKEPILDLTETKWDGLTQFIEFKKIFYVL